MRLFDCHAHYQDEQFKEKFEGGVSAVLGEVLAPGSGVVGILNAATDLPSCEATLALARAYPGVYAAVGIHPEDCGKYDVSEIPAVMEKLKSYCLDPKVLAIGEIGLDYYWEENPPRETQKAWFEAQLTLAEELDLPVVIHDREAHGDTYEAVLRHPRLRGMMHSYSGSGEIAKELLKRGWYLSFSGVITFKNAVKPAEVLKIVPPERLLTETDCPYLAPVPMRGKPNRSDYMHFTLEKEAEILGVDPGALAARTLRNAEALFGIPLAE